MPITSTNKIDPGEYQQQGKLISELPSQPKDLSAEELQARFDALGLYIIECFNGLVDNLLTAFVADNITNAALTEGTVDDGEATTVAGQLAYLLYKVNHATGGTGGALPAYGTITDAYLSGDAAAIKQRVAGHFDGTGVKHTVAHLPTGTGSTQLALGNHTHSAYAPVAHNQAATTITSGTFDLARLPTTTGTESTKVSLGSHIHDGRYYTESEMNTKLDAKADEDHTHYANEIVTGSGMIADTLIPLLAIGKISGLQGALDAKYGPTNKPTSLTALNITGAVGPGDPQVVNVYLGTSATPPTGQINGTLYIQYQ